MLVVHFLATLASEDHPHVLTIVMACGITLSVLTLFITLSSMLCYLYCHGECKSKLHRIFVKPLKSSNRTKGSENLHLFRENGTNFGKTSEKTNSSASTKTGNEMKTLSKG